MRHTGGAEQSRREQLVVTAEQRRRSVEKAYALSFELGDAPDPVLDAVELIRHVESVERDVAGAELE